MCDPGRRTHLSFHHDQVEHASYSIQVAEKLALAQAETQDVALADRAYDEAQKAVADGRRMVTNCLPRIWRKFAP